MLAKVIIFGMLGICLQLIITAAMKTISTRRLDLTGEASIILLPAYGLIGIAYPIIALHFGNLPWYLRGAIYMLAFYVFQYMIGLLLRKINICPWNYTGKFSLHGLVRLADAPIWFACGLLIELVYPYVKAAANFL